MFLLILFVISATSISVECNVLSVIILLGVCPAVLVLLDPSWVSVVSGESQSKRDLTSSTLDAFTRFVDRGKKGFFLPGDIRIAALASCLYLQYSQLYEQALTTKLVNIVMKSFTLFSG